MCRALAVVAALAALLALAPAAQAFRSGGQKWPGRPATISYWNGTGYKAAVRQAVHAWNTSGARVRFVRAPRSRAKVRIVYDRGGALPFGAAHGYASIGRQPVNRVQLSRGGRGETITLVVAHELGHILGLDHEARRCATMNASVAQLCGTVPPCTVLQADDVRGAIARYGGRVRARPPEFCPGTPGDLRVEPLPDAYGMQVVVKNVPASNQVLARVGSDRCPAHPAAGDTASGRRARAARARSAGAEQRIDIGPSGDPAKWAGKSYCVSVWLMDSFGRTSAKPATKRFTASATPLPAPRQLIVAASDFSARLSWANSAHSAAITHEIAWAPGDTCPASPTAAPDDRRSSVYAATENATISLPVGGHWCFAVWTRDQYEHLSAPALVTADIPGNFEPKAGFTVAPQPGTAGLPVTFTDTSTDPENAIASWSWTFNDVSSGGANTSTLRSPAHVFATEGLYEVTLKITDAGGLTSEASFRVEIASAGP